MTRHTEPFSYLISFFNTQLPTARPIEMKGITRSKVAVIFESANLRKFLSLFGSKAVNLQTSDRAKLEVFVV
jgi:hypothetical protein